MIFNEIFTQINKIFEMDRHFIYFKDYINIDILPIIEGFNIKTSSYNNYRQYMFTVNNYNIYIVKGDLETCIIKNIYVDDTLSHIVFLNNNFLKNDIKSVSDDIKEIYSVIFDNCFEAEFSLAPSIFTLYTVLKFIPDVDKSIFDFDGTSDIFKIYDDYTIEELYDHNKIYYFMKELKGE